jgi:hypothetical protein
MKSLIHLKKNCNIFIPRNIYSLFLILSKKKSIENDDYIIINNHKTYCGGATFSKDVITFLKKKKYKIIYTKKTYLFKKNKKLSNNFINKFFKINFFKNLSQINNEILRIKYEEFITINFDNYKNINIYYGSNILYYSKFCKKFKNTNLFFLEHGMGNFISMQIEAYKQKNFKKFIERFIKNIFFKIRGIKFPNSNYYFGLAGYFFNIKEMESNNGKIIFLNFNLKKGFQELFKFYQQKLKKLRINKKSNYIFLDTPYHYNLKIYKQYLNYICEKEKFKKNIFLLKIHPDGVQKEKINYFINTMKSIKKKYYFVNEKYNEIPAEFFIKYLNINEIYSGYSSLLFSTHIINEVKKVNFIYSKKVIKKYKNRDEFDWFSIQIIKRKFIDRDLNFINLD